MAGVLGLLFAIGFAILALSQLLPQPAGIEQSRLWLVSGVALLIGVTLVLTAGRVGRWTIHFALMAATVLITLSVYYGGDTGTMYSFYYVWVSSFAFFFLGRRGGLFEVLIIAIVYGALLVFSEQALTVARWLLTISTIMIAGAMIDTFAARIRGQADRSAAQARALAAAGGVARQLARSTDSAPPAGLICDAVAEALGSSGASFWQPSEDGTQMIAIGATHASLIGHRQPLGGPPSGVVSCFTDKRVIFSPNVADDSRLDTTLRTEFGQASALFQPILDHEVAIAVLVVEWNRPIDELDADTTAAIGLIADETAISIQRSALLRRLEDSAHTDSLTGLLNRRGWAVSLSRELARARRLHSPPCVAMLDLDHFKRLNDEVGHYAGDLVLKQTSARWASCTRDGDILARYGGDEFVLALPDCEIDDAMRQLDRLQKCMQPDGSTSAGVVLWNGDENGFDLVERADRALYAAKREGRARIIAA